jgi:hypothetical protein
MTRLAALLLLLVALIGGRPAVGDGVVPVPVTPQPYAGAAVAESTWAVLDAAGDPVGTATWRVVEGTGNCCENFLMAAPDGRIFNWGGTHIIYSDDDGLTWAEVRAPAASPADNGEGAIAAGPDGDVLGVTWDPYQGDRLQSFRFDAQTAAWSYAEQPLHLPFYDRPWFTTVPGADTGVVGGGGEEYLSVARGAYPSKDVLQYSGDGLTYPLAGSKRLEAAVTDPVGGPLPILADPSADWTQPHAETSVVPLGGGHAFGGREFIGTGVEPCDTPRFLMLPDRSWHCYTGGVDVQWLAVDSTGALHAAEWSPAGTITYRRSEDGGLTTTDIPLRVPAGVELGPDLDLRANGALGVVAIAVAGRSAEGLGQHMVVVIEQDPLTGAWAQDRTLLVGDGDLDYGAGVGASIRFDFASVALLPDGRVAASFNDDSHRTPAVAIELPRAGTASAGTADAGSTPGSPLGPLNPGRLD